MKKTITATVPKTGLIHNLLCGLSAFINVLLFGGHYWQTTSAACGQMIREHGGRIMHPWRWPNAAWWCIWKITELTDRDHATEAQDRELNEQKARLIRAGRL